ncbi:MAG: glycosyltransferase, partial [Prevotella sp.]|nr:glycosyltransferase [Prevotella sp.]
QWGLPFLPIRVINKACKGLDVKVISVYHNQVDTNGKLKAADLAIEHCTYPILKPILHLRRVLVKAITSYSMKYVYHHSDIYEVLSPSFIELFKTFTGIKNPKKLVVQTNPITIEMPEVPLEIELQNKQREIIYVGRLDFIQKRVHRIIDTWNYLEEQNPDWRLTIVGDGSDRQNLEQYVKSLGLKNVCFEGFRNPVEYYKRASILMLTSDFEGFGLVIIEAMAYGIVPFVYGSYPAVYDIIDDGKDGIIIPFHKDGYRPDEAAGMAANIMSNDEKRNRMALAAIEKSRKFSVGSIMKEWIKVFIGLKL